MLETWKWIEGYPDYQASSWGRIRYHKVSVTNYMLTPVRRSDCHLVRLHGVKGSPTVAVHELVLIAFKGICPDGHVAMRYPDPDHSNNAPDNLLWVTPEAKERLLAELAATPKPVSPKRDREMLDAKNFELDLAKDLGGRRVFLSGAGIEKADVRKQAKYVMHDGIPRRAPTLTFRVEAKTTRYDSFVFKAVDWFDLIRVADASGENPIFAMRFLRAKEDLAVVRCDFVQALGLTVPDYVQGVTGGIRLRPGTSSTLRMIFPKHPGDTRRPDVLAVLPYSVLLKGIQHHADFTAGTTNTHTP